MVLKKGSTGDDVKRLQIKLGLTPDSGVAQFGPKTEAAVKAWQKSNGLDDDGVVGDITWNKLFNINSEILNAVTQNSSISLDKLKGHVPQGVLDELAKISESFGITNNLRLAHFLAQCAHESGSWKYRVEIASGQAYEGRKDLGNTQTGDGVRFKGRGYIQLTGRVNYGKFSQFIGEDCIAQPELVANKYPLASAAFFFNKNKLWTACDLGSTDEIVTKVSRRVNGGTNGLADRLKKFKVYYNILK
jgi:putative chitinase